MRIAPFVAVMAILPLIAAPASADEVVELPSYFLMVDEVITRKANAAAGIYFAYNQKSLAKKLSELGVKLPGNVNFPQGSLLILAVTDHTDQAFASMSALPAKRRLIVNLKADEKADKPDKAEKGKKHSRVLVIACPPVRGVQEWAVQTKDGEQKLLKGEELGAEKEDDNGGEK